MGFLRPKIIAQYGLERFTRLIETGTARGQGVERLAHTFKEILTVELSPEMAREAQGRLKDLANVTVFTGPSPAFLLSQIDPTVPTLLFLDAHYMHSRRTTGDAGFLATNLKQCPLLEELAVIFSFQWTAEFAILIDDWRLFNNFERTRRMPKRGYKLAEWPTSQQIKAKLEQHGFKHEQLDDMLLAVRNQ